jgi:hypothetical protein
MPRKKPEPKHRKVKYRPKHRATPKTRCETTGKTKYGSKGQALSATLNRAIKGGKPLRAYKCPDCNTWHMTSKVPQHRKG